MPIEVYEAADSRRLTTGDNPTAELYYHVRGTTDPLAVKPAVAGVAPSYYDGKRLDALDIEPTGSASIWRVRARYIKKKPEDQPPGESTGSFRFATTGGTAHITHSYETVSSWSRIGRAAPDYNGAIGVTDDGVEGVDVQIPIFGFQVTRAWDASQISAGYVANLFRLTAAVNDRTVQWVVDGVFLEFKKGELRFAGADGSKRASDDAWEITYYFEASPNVEDLDLGPVTVGSKRGWDYLWVRYFQKTDTDDDGKLVKIPYPTAYVERVYRYENFAPLGL